MMYVNICSGNRPRLKSRKERDNTLCIDISSGNGSRLKSRKERTSLSFSLPLPALRNVCPLSPEELVSLPFGCDLRRPAG